MKFVLLVEYPVGIVRVFSPFFASEDGPDIFAIDFFLRQLTSDEFREGGEKVDIHPGSVADSSRWNFPRPAHDAWLTKAPFPSRSFPFAKWTRGSCMRSVGEPRTIIARE